MFVDTRCPKVINRKSRVIWCSYQLVLTSAFEWVSTIEDFIHEVRERRMMQTAVFLPNTFIKYLCDVSTELNLALHIIGTPTKHWSTLNCWWLDSYIHCIHHLKLFNRSKTSNCAKTRRVKVELWGNKWWYMWNVNVWSLMIGRILENPVCVYG